MKATKYMYFEEVKDILPKIIKLEKELSILRKEYWRKKKNIVEKEKRYEYHKKWVKEHDYHRVYYARNREKCQAINKKSRNKLSDEERKRRQRMYNENFHKRHFNEPNYDRKLRKLL